jgi:hypothetical protein
VIATDPVTNVEYKLCESIDAAWKALAVIGLSPGATRDRLYFKYEWKVVDRIENLNEEDFDNLMATIKHLRVVLHK